MKQASQALYALRRLGFFQPEKAFGMSNGLTILGIDPGSQCLGWGVVEERSGVLRLVDCGTVRPRGESFEQRLAALFTEFSAVVTRLVPQEAAMENVFVQKNALSALKLGQARGVAIAACAAQKICITGYAPTIVKKSLVGSGHAEKIQVSFMVGRILGVKPDWAADAGDALACAICHANARRLHALAVSAREQR